MKLLPDEKFVTINLYQQTVSLKIIYYFRIEISFTGKQKFFIQNAINVFLWVNVGKSACITRMGAVRNYSTNTIMDKKTQWG